MNVDLKQKFFAICATAAMATWGLSASAQVWHVSTADGNGADTFLSNDSNAGPGVVHGAGGTMNVRSLFESRARVTMLRFDVSGISDFTNTQLQIEQTSGTRDRTLQVYGLNDGIDWDEAATSYSNAPGVISPAPDGMYEMDLSQVTLLGTFDVFTGPQLLTSSPADLPLDDFLSNHPNGLVTLFLTFDPSNTDSNPDYFFASKENTAGHIAPRLTNIPEPSSLVLSSLTLIGLAMRRRR